MENQDDRQPPSETSERQDLETRLDYSFKNSNLLERALTHSSFAHETRTEVSGSLPEDYEGLEFLGDAILGFVITEFLFRTYPSRDEGELSKMKAFLVSTEHLASLSRQLDLGAFTRLSYGEEKTGGRQKRAILADLFESIVAAIYLDGGFESARRFILLQFGNSFEQIAQEEVDYRDYKSLLQEMLHKRNLPEPTYRIVDESGPDHNKEFVVSLHIQERFLAHGSGPSKKEAQQKAAERALEVLRLNQE